MSMISDNLERFDIVRTPDLYNIYYGKGFNSVASNFQIVTFKNNGSLHLKLYGDFDADSAQELANTLIEHGARSRDIFIDTKNLETVHPFGKTTLQMNLRNFQRKINNFFFTGSNKHKLT